MSNKQSEIYKEIMSNRINATAALERDSDEYTKEKLRAQIALIDLLVKYDKDPDDIKKFIRMQQATQKADDIKKIYKYDEYKLMPIEEEEGLILFTFFKCDKPVYQLCWSYEESTNEKPAFQDKTDLLQ